MRFLIRIVIPTAAENAIVSDPNFDESIGTLYLAVGGQEAFAQTEKGRRVDYVLVDIQDLGQITPTARRIFEFLRVKPEFLPQLKKDPIFGR